MAEEPQTEEIRKKTADFRIRHIELVEQADGGTQTAGVRAFLDENQSLIRTSYQM